MQSVSDIIDRAREEGLANSDLVSQVAEEWDVAETVASEMIVTTLQGGDIVVVDDSDS